MAFLYLNQNNQDLLLTFVSDPDFFFLFFSVVTQAYESEAENEYVIRGNNVVIKCKIPSYAADFISIVSWFDSDDTEFTPNNNFGITNFNF